MKKTILPILFIITQAACIDKDANTKHALKVPFVQDLATMKETEFVATLESELDSGKNSVYASSLLMAWNQFQNSFGYPLVADSSNLHPEFLALTISNSYKNILDSADVETSFEQHPDGSVSVYAGFSLLLPFEYDMHVVKHGIRFGGKHVRAFGIEHTDELADGGVSVLCYVDDEHFAVALHPRDHQHVIILVTGIDLNGTFTDLLTRAQVMIDTGDAQLNHPDRAWRRSFNEDDTLRVPEISFNINKSWNELSGQKFMAPDGQHFIVAAAQRTAFVLNNKGAIIESESFLMADSIWQPGEDLPHPKRLVFDQPFLIYAKKWESKFPYFAMKVENPELMVPNDTEREH